MFASPLSTTPCVPHSLGLGIYLGEVNVEPHHDILYIGTSKKLGAPRKKIVVRSDAPEIWQLADYFDLHFLKGSPEVEEMGDLQVITYDELNDSMADEETVDLLAKELPSFEDNSRLPPTYEHAAEEDVLRAIGASDGRHRFPTHFDDSELYCVANRRKGSSVVSDYGLEIGDEYDDYGSEMGDDFESEIGGEDEIGG
eukprot:Selendium_serpulae@DN216_c0_g1_i1.p1